MNLNKLLEVKSKLNERWVSFSFVKKDGTHREMVGTTNLTLIPEQFHPKEKVENKTIDDLDFEVEVKQDPNPSITVFEKDKGWRSFKLLSLKNFDGEVFFYD